MALTNFPYGLTSFGIPVPAGDGAIPVTGGSVFWVNSSTGQDAVGKGTSPSDPFRTIDYAIGRCTANKGDTILVMPGHTEAISAAGGITIDVAGINIIGLGEGTLRPTITFTTTTAATITWSAANCRLRNVILDMASGALDAVVAALTITGACARIENVYGLMADATYQGVTLISLGSGANKARIVNLDVDATAAAGAAQAILAAAAVSDLAIINPRIRGNFSNAAELYATGTNHVTDLYIEGGQVWQQNGTAKVVIDVTTSSTGLVAKQSWRGTTWATAANSVGSNSTGLKYFENYGFDDATGASSGVLCPAAGTLA